MPDTIEQQNILTPNPLGIGKATRKLPEEPGMPIDISDDERAKLTTELVGQFHEVESARAPMEARIKRHWKEYFEDEAHLATTNGILEKASNVNVPLLQWVCNGVLAQLVQSTFGASPFFLVNAGRSGDPERAGRVEKYFDYLVDNDLDYPALVEQMYLRALLEGAGIAYVWWERKYEFTYERISSKSEALSATEESVFQPKWIAKWRVVSESPKVDVVPRSQFYMFPNDSPDPQKAQSVFYVCEITRNKLIRGKKDGTYVATDEEWKKILGSGDGQAARFDEKGEGDSSLATASARRTFSALFCYTNWDADGDGLEEPCTFLILEEAEVMVQAVLTRSGSRRPFELFHVMPQANRPFAITMGQLVDWAAGVMNTLLNQKLNDTNLRHLMAKTLIYGINSGFDPELFKLGKPFQVQDPSQITTISIDAMPEILGLLEYIVSIVERQTGLSDVFMGKSAEGSQTATETQATVSLGSARFDQMVKRLDRGHKRVASQLGRLHYEYMEDETLSYYVQADRSTQDKALRDTMAGAEQMGMDPAEVSKMWPTKGLMEEQKVKREDFAPDPGLDYEAHGSSASMNRDVRIRDASNRLQMFGADQTIGLPGQWELKKDLLEAQGVAAPERIIGEKPDAQVAIPTVGPDGQPVDTDSMNPAAPQPGMPPPGATQGGGQVPPMPVMPNPAPGMGPGTVPPMAAQGAGANPLMQMLQGGGQ